MIETREVSDDVAELLSRRLLRLPESERRALEVMSVFGSQVPLTVLNLVRDGGSASAHLLTKLLLPLKTAFHIFSPRHFLYLE